MGHIAGVQYAIRFMVVPRCCSRFSEFPYPVSKNRFEYLIPLHSHALIFHCSSRFRPGSFTVLLD